MKYFKEFRQELSELTDDNTAEDKTYVKGNTKYTLHRKDDVHHLVANGKTVEKYRADPYHVHKHLTDRGFKLADTVSQRYAKKDWFKESANIPFTEIEIVSEEQ